MAPRTVHWPGAAQPVPSSSPRRCSRAAASASRERARGHALDQLGEEAADDQLAGGLATRVRARSGRRAGRGRSERPQRRGCRRRRRRGSRGPGSRRRAPCARAAGCGSPGRRRSAGRPGRRRSSRARPRWRDRRGRRGRRDRRSCPRPHAPAWCRSRGAGGRCRCRRRSPWRPAPRPASLVSILILPFADAEAEGDPLEAAVALDLGPLGGERPGGGGERLAADVAEVGVRRRRSAR